MLKRKQWISAVRRCRKRPKCDEDKTDGQEEEIYQRDKNIAELCEFKTKHCNYKSPPSKSSDSDFYDSSSSHSSYNFSSPPAQSSSSPKGNRKKRLKRNNKNKRNKGKKKKGFSKRTKRRIYFLTALGIKILITLLTVYI